MNLKRTIKIITIGRSPQRTFGRALVLALTLLLIISFIIIFSTIRNRDERQIRRNLISLATMVSKSGNENEFVALANIRKIKSLFTPDCQIMVGAPIPETIGQDMLISTIYQTRKMVDKIDVDFYNISVIIGENCTTAKATMTVEATGPDPRGGGEITEAREVEMHWKRVEGAWKIAEVQLPVQEAGAESGPVGEKTQVGNLTRRE